MLVLWKHPNDSNDMNTNKGARQNTLSNSLSVGCNLYGMGVAFFGLNSIITLCAIACERYIVITSSSCRPVVAKWRITRRQAQKVIWKQLQAAALLFYRYYWLGIRSICFIERDRLVLEFGCIVPLSCLHLCCSDGRPTCRKEYWSPVLGIIHRERFPIDSTTFISSFSVSLCPSPYWPSVMPLFFDSFCARPKRLRDWLRLAMAQHHSASRRYRSVKGGGKRTSELHW